MTNNPGDDVPDRDDNPFKGTPFEQFFANMGGNFGALFGQGGAGGAGMPDLGALFGQIQAMMQPYDGALNWDAALDMARRAVAQEKDPSPSQKQQEQVADAVRLADLWLDETTGRCRHYPFRPQACRDVLEAGDELCLQFRSDAGLPV